MANDYPDYLNPAGRNVEGGSMTSYSFSFEVEGESGVYFDFPVVTEGCENIYQCLTISCNDDSAIHLAELVRVSDLWLFFSVNFITGGIFDFPGQAIVAGQTVRIYVYNNSASTLTFSGALNYVTRAI